MLRGVIFQKLCATSGNIIQFIPFVHTFYAFESPLFYSHHNREGDVTIIPSTMGSRQGGPSGGALLVLAHFRALHSRINHFPSCLCPSIGDYTHMISPPSIVSSGYEHFQTKLCEIGIFIQLHKCVAWSITRLQHPIPIYHPIQKN
jgi:hypothetical protein